MDLLKLLLGDKMQSVFFHSVNIIQQLLYVNMLLFTNFKSVKKKKNVILDVIRDKCKAKRIKLHR